MKIFAIIPLLVPLALLAAQPETEMLAAGPFRVSVPKAFAKGAIVEKVEFVPLYSADEWAAAKRDPMLVLKPSYANRPQHWAIRLPKAVPEWYEADLKTAGDDPTAPQILIHKANEWASALEDGTVNAEAAKKFVAKMRKDLALWLKQSMNRISPGYMDASTEFDCLKRKIAFEGGSGVRWILQWNIEPDLARRGRLHYLFLGLSDDGSCQIIATFPLDLPGLPDDSPDAIHLGYSTKEYEKLGKEFKSYENAVKKWLSSHANEITPKLAELDAMMASLFVKRWE